MALDADRLRRHGLQADDSQQESGERANRKEVR